MTRPHPLTLLFGLVLFALFVWMNCSPRIGSVLYWQQGITKSHVGCGWPFSFLFLLNGDTRIQFPPLLLNLAAAFVLFAAPIRVCHRLLRRTLHIQLRTAVLLMLVASILLFLNIRIQEDTSWIHVELLRGWPMVFARSAEDEWHWWPQKIAANTLIALAILSTVLLLSEHLLTRRKPLENA